MICRQAKFLGGAESRDRVMRDGKSGYDKITAADCPILLKFDQMVHHASDKANEWLKSTFGQIQDGGCCPNLNVNFYSRNLPTLSIVIRLTTVSCELRYSCCSSERNGPIEMIAERVRNNPGKLL